MKKSLLFALTMAAALGCSALYADDSGKNGKQDNGKHDDRSNILEFQNMVGVPRPYTGATNAIRGVAGGGLPWVIGSAQGELDVDGHLEVQVTGLVIDPNDPAAITAGAAGQNPLATFAAIVSCQSKDMAGAATVVNMMTSAFPATTGPATAGGGNARIETFLQLPKPCIAPIVFVTSPGGAWFAATGF